MPATRTLHEVFIHELRDMYNAEQQLTKALPQLIDAAHSEELREALAAHLGETRDQIGRLDQAFDLLEETPQGVPCEGMSGIIREGQAVIGDGATGPVRDAALIGAAQRVEHYETAVYGTLIAWASAMGHDEVVTLLKDSLEEEKNADATLSKLAETGINEAALSAEGADMASSHPGGKASGRGKHSSRRASGQARGDQ